MLKLLRKKVEIKIPIINRTVDDPLVLAGINVINFLNFANSYLAVSLSVRCLPFLSACPVCLSVCLSFVLKVCMWEHLSICTSVCFSACRPVLCTVFRSFCLSVHVCACQYVFVSVCLMNVYLHICLAVPLSFCLPACLPSCLPV